MRRAASGIALPIGLTITVALGARAQSPASTPPVPSDAPATTASAPPAPATSGPPVSATPATPPPPAPHPAGTCVERIPSGKARPKLTEKIAPNAISGHAHLLQLTVEHGPGETVLPTGFRLDPGTEEAKAFEATGFVFPDPAGPSAPKIERQQKGDRATTTVSLYFVPLPAKPGRNTLVLPPLPVAVARASGEIMTLCTSAHTLTVEDPIANEPNPKPKPNPPPRRQLEEWTFAKHATIVAAIALLVGALAAWLILRWLKRPRPQPPPPPPRPPWEVALEGLFDLRHAGLLENQRHAEFYDRVSDVIRRYLGDRYGYDGLESTTREALTALRRVSIPLDVFVQIQQFMQDADLVKFARRAPTEAECTAVLTAAEAIVEATRPKDVTSPPATRPETAPEVTP